MPKYEIEVISNNTRRFPIKREECEYPKKVIEVIDLSNNQIEIFSLTMNSFFKCLGSKKLYLKGINIRSFNVQWQFFDKYLRVLDLKYNQIKELIVSVVLFN